MRRLRHWPIEHATVARVLHERWMSGQLSATQAVKHLHMRGAPEPWNLWLDVCNEDSPVEAVLASYGRAPKTNPDGTERRSRQLPLSRRGSS